MLLLFRLESVMIKKELSDIYVNKSPFFSIVISTCNRPDLLKRCLNKVFEQSYDNYEVIIINNGSKPYHEEKYRRIERIFDERFKFYDLNNRMSAGIGPAYARNLGISVAHGKYIAFCDDDDEWIDPNYLLDIENYLNNFSSDLVVSNQFGISEAGTDNPSPKIWFKNIEKYLSTPTKQITKLLDVNYFSDNGAFPHLNISIYKSSFIKQLGGFDKKLWYEEDLDLFLRALQENPSIAFNSKFVAKHYIPNKEKMTNITSNIDEITKHKLRVVYLQNLINEYGLNKSNNFIKSLACNTFKHLTMTNMANKDYRTARMHAFSAHCIKPTFKWFAYFIYISFLVFLRGIR